MKYRRLPRWHRASGMAPKWHEATGLNPILVDIIWKLGVFMTLLGFGLFCVWVASELAARGW